MCQNTLPLGANCMLTPALKTTRACRCSLLTMHHPQNLYACATGSLSQFPTSPYVSTSSGHVSHSLPFLSFQLSIPTPLSTLLSLTSHHNPFPTCLTSKAHPTARKKPYVSSEHVKKFEIMRECFWWDFTFLSFSLFFFLFLFSVGFQISIQRPRNE
jgi:hypothetical protein